MKFPLTDLLKTTAFVCGGALLGGIWFPAGVCAGLVGVALYGIEHSKRAVWLMAATAGATYWMWPKVDAQGQAAALHAFNLAMEYGPYVVAGLVLAAFIAMRVQESDTQSGKMMRNELVDVSDGRGWLARVETLQVPFRDNEMVQALGARWSQEQRAWYIPQGMDRVPFTRWLPE